MNKLFFLGLIGLSVFSCTRKRDTLVPAIYSESVKDSFELYIDLPPGYASNDSNYSVVFYMDANLKMGKEIRRQIKLDENKTHLQKVIFVGVGHIGPYRKLRRRDFIPPVIKNGEIQESKDPDFGHADQFYRFLVFELIPQINNQYPNNGRFTYIGHSFSGLFAFYSALQPNQPFKNYVGLSPSLWANYCNFFEYESRFNNSHPNLPINFYHACGTAEWSNKVLSTSRKMNALFREHKYPGFGYTYVEHTGKNHNGVVPVSINYILKHTAF